MKRLLLSALSVAVLSYAAPSNAADAADNKVAPAAAPASVSGTYSFDASHTSASWTVAHMGYSHFSGKFPGITGTLVLDEAHPENSKVSITVNPGDVVTGVDKLNEHLRPTPSSTSPNSRPPPSSARRSTRPARTRRKSPAT